MVDTAGQAAQLAQAAMADAIHRILKAGKAPGILSSTEEQARKWLDAGALFVAVGVDTMLLRKAAADLLARYRAPAAPAPLGGNRAQDGLNY